MQNLGSRNDTTFQTRLSELLSKVEPHKFLERHQVVPIEYFCHYNNRGLLLYHDMGSGKTLTFVGAAETLINEARVQNKKPKTILFISDKTLHDNAADEIRKYLGETTKMSEKEIEAHLAKHYKFVSLNASNMLFQLKKQLEPEDFTMQEAMFGEKLSKNMDRLENTMIVIDEAHKFFNSVANGSANAVGLYDIIMRTVDCKVLLMSGTPIVNHPFELAIGLNLVSGPPALFGENFQEFSRYFIAGGDPNAADPGTQAEIRIRNALKFGNRISGLVSYYNPREGKLRDRFPTLRSRVVDKIAMSDLQYGMYWSAREKELEEKNFGTMQAARLSKPKGASSTYRIKSRTLSNIFLGTYSTAMEIKNGIETQKRGASKRAEAIKGGDEAPDEDELDGVDLPDVIKSSKTYKKPVKITAAEENAILDILTKENLPDRSAKISQMLKNIALHLPWTDLPKHDKADQKKYDSSPGLVYSQFKMHGVLAVAKALKLYGFKELKNIEDAVAYVALPESQKKGSFSIISGSVAMESRTAMKDLLRSKENKDGKVLSLLLFTSTGAQGISTKYVRHVHMLEPYWNDVRFMQAETRAYRLDSHVELPMDQRFVQPYVYLSDYPKGFDPKKKVEETTDVTLYIKGVENHRLNEEFLRILRSRSIDCVINNFNSVKCFKCDVVDNVNKMLFVPDLDRDMMSPSPCVDDTAKPESSPSKVDVVKVDIKMVKLPSTSKPIKIGVQKVGDVTHLYMMKSKNVWQEINQRDKLYNVLLAAS